MHNGDILDIAYIPLLYQQKPQPKDNIEYDNRFYKDKSYNIFPTEYYNPNWSNKNQTQPVNKTAYSPYPVIIKYPNFDTVSVDDSSWDDIIKNKQFTMWGNVYLYDNEIRKAIEYRQYSPFDNNTNNYYKTYIQYNLETDEMFYINRSQNNLNVDILDTNWHQYIINTPHLPKNIEKIFQTNLYDVYTEHLKNVKISDTLNPFVMQILNDYEYPIVFEQIDYESQFVYNKEYIKDKNNYIRNRCTFENNKIVITNIANTQTHIISEKIDINNNILYNLKIDDIYDLTKSYTPDSYTITLNNQKIINQNINTDINIVYDTNNTLTNINIVNHTITITNSKVTIIIDKDGNINIQQNGKVDVQSNGDMTLTQPNIFMNGG